MVKTPMPNRVGSMCGAHCLFFAVSDDDEAADPDLRHRAGAFMVLAPDSPISTGEAACFMSRVQADDIETPASSSLGTLGGMDAIPDRRMGLLQRLKLHRDIIE